MMTFRKNLSLLLLMLFVLQPFTLASSAETQEVSNGSLVDDSIKDLSIVLGSGFVGTILGLSTLSFVDTPSKHTKNIAVGGAIGIVIGVGVVVFGQVTRSTSVIGLEQIEKPMNAAKYANLTRKEFSEVRIAKNYFNKPTLDYNFSF